MRRWSAGHTSADGVNGLQAQREQRKPLFPGGDAPVHERLAPTAALEAPARGAAQRSERVLGRKQVQVFRLVAFHDSRHRLSAVSPRRIQLFTDPSGSPISLATSVCVSPPW